MASHAFVAMPFGQKPGFDGAAIDFDAVYRDLIRPALVEAGFEVFRADEETRAGDILPDMFQELLAADLVVVDLSIDNPNVWYELGVRHALRTRGVLLVQSHRPYQPFDTYTSRKLTYHLANGKPDPAHLGDDRRAMGTMAADTVSAWYRHRASPVFQHLPHLQPPTWGALQVGEATEFRERHEMWKQRLTLARRKGRAGDILLLAEEGSTRLLRLEAYRDAGAELRAAGKLAFSLEQYERALAIQPDDLESRRQKGLLLGKLGRRDEAREWLKSVARDVPGDAETLTSVGRLEKDEWTATWRKPGASTSAMRAAAADDDTLLLQAINWYAKGFTADPRSHFAGANAVTLLTLLGHLGLPRPDAWNLDIMHGAARWAAQSTLQLNERDYWARVTLAELDILMADAATVGRVYKAAVAIAEKDWFALNSSREQLTLLRDLEFRPAEVARAIEVLDRAVAKLSPPQPPPNRVLIFSGHMIDARTRATPRFPHDKRDVARRAIEAVLDTLAVGPEDAGLCGGACGGDLLFAESMLDRGARMELRLAGEEPDFLRNSVAFAKATPPDDDWRDRFFRVKANPRTTLLVLPAELGPTPVGISPNERCNVWQIYSALAYGPDNVHAVLLWNGESGDGRGGTRHMHDEINRRTGQVHVLSTTSLW